MSLEILQSRVDSLERIRFLHNAVGSEQDTDKSRTSSTSGNDVVAIVTSVDDSMRRARHAVERAGCYSAVWKWVPVDYYKRPLSQRASSCLQASSVDALCKSLVLENKKAVSTSAADTPDPTNPQYIMVIVQYASTLNVKKLVTAMRKLRPVGKRLDESAFDYRMAEDAVNITGYTHNSVTPFGCVKALAEGGKVAVDIPIVLTSAVVPLKFFWMGGGHVHLKLGMSVTDFLRATKPIVIADISDPRSNYDTVVAEDEAEQGTTRNELVREVDQQVVATEPAHMDNGDDAELAANGSESAAATEMATETVKEVEEAALGEAYVVSEANDTETHEKGAENEAVGNVVVAIDEPASEGASAQGRADDTGSAATTDENETKADEAAKGLNEEPKDELVIEVPQNEAETPKEESEVQQIEEESVAPVGASMAVEDEAVYVPGAAESKVEETVTGNEEAVQEVVEPATANDAVQGDDSAEERIEPADVMDKSGQHIESAEDGSQAVIQKESGEVAGETPHAMTQDEIEATGGFVGAGSAEVVGAAEDTTPEKDDAGVVESSVTETKGVVSDAVQDTPVIAEDVSDATAQERVVAVSDEGINTADQGNTEETVTSNSTHSNTDESSKQTHSSAKGGLDDSSRHSLDESSRHSQKSLESKPADPALASIMERRRRIAESGKDAASATDPIKSPRTVSTSSPRIASDLAAVLARRRQLTDAAIEPPLE